MQGLFALPLTKTGLASPRDTYPLVAQTYQTIVEASEVMPHGSFQNLLSRAVKALLKRAQVESLTVQQKILECCSQLVSAYGGGLELLIRTMILEIVVLMGCKGGEEIQGKIEKLKHMLIHSEAEYLLGRVFLLEERWVLGQSGDEQSAYRSLKKCLELNEQHSIECLREDQEVRKELSDVAIMAYFECFRIKKTRQPQDALESLHRAVSTCSRNYGKESSLTRSLLDLYACEESAVVSLEKASAKSQAMTEIMEQTMNKNFKVVAYYCWEEERIVAHLVRVRPRHEVVSEASYDVKLDINKIKMLREGDWLLVHRGLLEINQDELLRLLGVTTMVSPQSKDLTTRIEMRNITREDIVKKDSIASSSSGDADFFEKEDFKFMRMGRTQSSKKYKESQ